MLRLIIILLIIYIFVRFYKHLSFSVTSSSSRGRVNDDQYQNQQQVNHKPPFDDVEEAEFVEIKEDKKEETGSEAQK